MRKFFGFITCFFAFSMLVSCLPTTKPTLLPIAVIESFSIGTFHYVKNDINNYGRDTIVTESQSGSAYKFFIDQKQGLIYNPDSLPMGSIVTALKTSLKAQGTVYFENTRQNAEQYPYIVWSDEDTIDFSNPVKLRVISPDKSYTRYYQVNLNVHTQNPDSMHWSYVSIPDYFDILAVKAVQHEDSLYVLFSREYSPYSSAIRLDPNTGTYTELTLNGLPMDSRVSGLTSFHGKLFALYESSLYESSNGTDWSECSTNVRITQLAGVTERVPADTLLWGFTKDGAVYSADGSEWTSVPEISSPLTSVSYLSYRLTTNKNLYRSVIAGINLDGETEIYSKISDSDKWQKIMLSGHSSLFLPALYGLTVISYDGSLFAFGGQAIDGSIEAYKGFFQSLDNGLSWRFCDKYCLEYNTWNNFMQLPSELKESAPMNFSALVDNANTIWIFPSEGGVVYKGYINRLKY